MGLSRLLKDRRIMMLCWAKNRSERRPSQTRTPDFSKGNSTNPRGPKYKKTEKSRRDPVPKRTESPIARYAATLVKEFIYD
jgi:hypothetical protein